MSTFYRNNNCNFVIKKNTFPILIDCNDFFFTFDLPSLFISQTIER